MLRIFIIIILLLSSILAKNLKEISDYNVLHKEVVYDKENYTLIRSFKKQNQIYYLAVNENSLETKILVDKPFLMENNYRKSKYSKLLEKFINKPAKLQNDGVTTLNSSNIFITMDFCPSIKSSYEKGFFEKLALLSSKKESPITITLFISAKWIKKHKKDFLELITLQRDNKLNIIWGNHTYNHFYYPNTPLEKNFILAKNTNIKKEILELEKLLLSYNVVPSILFRFPGLVSDKKSIRTVLKLGLIPIGSDTWLAKGDKIKNGSIILLHGNKNEPKGIKEADKYIFKENNYEFGNILEEL